VVYRRRHAWLSVDFTFPERPLGNADVTFWVKGDGGLLGRLEVSKGIIVWVPRNARSGYELGSQKFDRLMQEHGDNR
jgi:hypothetical protein